MDVASPSPRRPWVGTMPRAIVIAAGTGPDPSPQLSDPPHTAAAPGRGRAGFSNSGPLPYKTADTKPISSGYNAAL